jgi:type II secretory ATPase GspE/PulE/Tfp pilus assembly ATPase PilB-like protein
VLYGLLATMRELPLALATIEEEVDLLFEGVTQVRLDPARGLDQGAALQVLVDQDVDVCLIRDVQPTMFVDAFQAARAGRLLLLEGGQDGAIAMLRRLREHGVPADDLVDCCPGIVASREIPAACQECLAPVTVMPRDAEAFAAADAGLAPLPESIPQPVGCPACRRRQTAGVMLVHELLLPGRALLDALAAGANDRELREIATGHGHIPLAATLREHLVAGRVRLADVLAHLRGGA